MGSDGVSKRGRGMGIICLVLIRDGIGRQGSIGLFWGPFCFANHTHCGWTRLGSVREARQGEEGKVGIWGEGVSAWIWLLMIPWLGCSNRGWGMF